MGRTLRVIARPNREAPSLQGHCLGKLVSYVEGHWAVECDALPGPQRARSTLMLDADTMREAAERQREVLLVFANGDATQPVVLGLLDEPTPAKPAEQPAAAAAPAPSHPDGFDAVVDGKRVLLEARDEIVLRCGEASITLRRNGRVIVRGAYVETRARGVNRIKGGSVQIN